MVKYTTVLKRKKIAGPNLLLRKIIALSTYFVLVSSSIAQTIDYRQQIKNLPTYSVKNSPFNAKGNGVANDTSAFTAVTNAIASAGGGKVIIPAGTYMLQNWPLTNNMTVECQAGVTLAIYGTFNGDNVGLIVGKSLANQGLNNVHINCHDAIFEGNKSNQSGGVTDGNSFGVAVYGWTNSSIDVGIVQNFWTDGLILTGYTGAFTPSNHITVHGHYTNNNRCGVSLINSTDDYLDIEVDNSKGTNPEAGFCIETDNSTEVTQNIYMHVKSHDNNQSAGYYFEQWHSRLNSGITIDCYQCYNNQQYGFRAETFSASYRISGLKVTGNFWNNGLASSGYYSVLFDPYVINSSINGNLIETNTGTSPFYFGGTGISIGDGQYRGATYDGCPTSGATGQVSTGAIFSHSPASFNPGCTGTLDTQIPGNINIVGNTITLNGKTFVASSPGIATNTPLGIGLTPNTTPTVANLQTLASGVNNTVFRFYPIGDLTHYWEGRIQYGTTNTDFCFNANGGGTSVMCLRTYGPAFNTVPGSYANNAAALAAGFIAGDLYRSGDALNIVH